MSPYKNVKHDALQSRECRLVAQMQALGRIKYEDAKLSGESRIDLTDLIASIGHDLREVRAELRTREQMFAVAV